MRERAGMAMSGPEVSRVPPRVYTAWMGLILYGGLGLLPLWMLIGYALLAQPGVSAQPPAALVWWSIGAVPACFITLMFAEAILVSRESRPDPWRHHRVMLVVGPMAALLYASGVTWERQEAERHLDEERIQHLVSEDPAVSGWIGPRASIRITLSQPNPDLTGAPLRYWVTAEAGERRVQAVVAANRHVTPAALTLVCIEREPGPVRQDAPPLRCGR